MLINYRQGIIRTQDSPPFLSTSGDSVFINADTEPTVVAFAFAKDDYIYTEHETVEAWKGPFNSQDYWLYWDLDIRTGERTFGSTTVEPTYGNTLPTNPVNEQHFFYLKERKMKVWKTNRWVDRIRVFSAKLSSGSVLEPYGLESQVGLHIKVYAGHLLFDDKGQPVKRFDNLGRGSFLTTESNLTTQRNTLNNVAIEGKQIDGKAVEPIPKYHCVTWKGRNKRMGIASYADLEHPCIGLSVEEFVKDDVKKFITQGYITDILHFNWLEEPNTPLFVGLNGELRTTPPNRYSIQRVGHIVDRRTIYVDIYERVLIETIIIPTPTPTPSTICDDPAIIQGYMVDLGEGEFLVEPGNLYFFVSPFDGDGDPLNGTIEVLTDGCPNISLEIFECSSSSGSSCDPDAFTCDPECELITDQLVFNSNTATFTLTDLQFFCDSRSFKITVDNGISPEMGDIIEDVITFDGFNGCA